MWPFFMRKLEDFMAHSTVCVTNGDNAQLFLRKNRRGQTFRLSIKNDTGTSWAETK